MLQKKQEPTIVSVIERRHEQEKEELERKVRVDEQRKIREQEEENRRLKEEEQARRDRDEEARLRRLKEEQARRDREEEARLRKLKEEQARREREEDERQRKIRENEERIRVQLEQERKSSSGGDNMYSLSSSILQNSKISTASPILTTQLELDISNIHAISHQLTQDIGALLGSAKEIDLIPVTQRVATIANVARYSATWLPVTNTARDKLTTDAATLVTLAETLIYLKRDGKSVTNAARNLLSFLLELCALITRAVTYHDQNPTPVPKQTNVLSRISETPPPVENVDPNDIVGLVKKNLNLSQSVYALLEFNLIDKADTTSRIRRFVNQVQAIQNAMADLALAVDVNTGNLIIEKARELMNSAMELVRVVRITTSENDYNFRNVIQQVKNNLNASINTLNSVQTVKKNLPNLI